MPAPREASDACFDRELLRGIVERVATTGADPAAVLRAAGLGPLEELAPRVPLAAGYDAWRRLELLSGDRLIGVRLAAGLTEGAVDLADYLVGACESLGDAVTLLARFHRLVHDEGYFTASVDGDTARLRVLHPPLPTPPASMVEWALGTWTSVIGLLMPHIAFEEVHCTHCAPPGISPSDYEAILGVPVRFEQEELAVLLPASSLAAPNPRADPRLRALLIAQAELRSSQLPERTHSVTERVRLAIAEALPEGGLDAESLAQRLHMRGRTLRRRLSDEGTTVSAELESVRMLKAKQHLTESARSLDEISYLLGFAQPASFHRAFKRWTGVTPTQFREGGR